MHVCVVTERVVHRHAEDWEEVNRRRVDIQTNRKFVTMSRARLQLSPQETPDAIAGLEEPWFGANAPVDTASRLDAVATIVVAADVEECREVYTQLEKRADMVALRSVQPVTGTVPGKTSKRYVARDCYFLRWVSATAR